MTALKGRDIAQFLKNGLRKPHAILIYGGNQGRITHYSQQLIDSYLGKEAGSDSIVTLEAESLNSDPGLLIDQANASSLFGDKILVRVRGSIKNPAKSVTPVLDQDLSNPVIIQTDNLTPSSPLRKMFEKSKTAIALPCYDPDIRELKAFVQDLLRNEDKSISADALNLLIGDLNDDLGYAQRETEKLILYVGDKQTVDIKDVFEISANLKDLDISQLADAIGNGDVARFEAEFDKSLEGSIAPSGVHAMLTNHFHMLYELRLLMDEKRQAANQIVKSHRPPIFFKRQDIIARQLGRWSAMELEKALNKIQSSILYIRKNPQLEISHMAMTYLSLCGQAARH